MMACSPGCSSGRGGGGELAVAGGTLQLVPTALGSKGSGAPRPSRPRSPAGALTDPLFQGGGRRGLSGPRLTLLQGAALVVHAAALELAQQVKEALLVGGRSPREALGGTADSADHRAGRCPLRARRTRGGRLAWAKVTTLIHRPSRFCEPPCPHPAPLPALPPPASATATPAPSSSHTCRCPRATPRAHLHSPGPKSPPRPASSWGPRPWGPPPVPVSLTSAAEPPGKRQTRERVSLRLGPRQAGRLAGHHAYSQWSVPGHITRDKAPRLGEVRAPMLHRSPAPGGVWATVS